MTENKEAPKEFDSKLLPILREAVDVVKMILFKELKDYFTISCPAQSQEAGRLAAGVLNDFFGVVNPDPAFADFIARNRDSVDQAVKEFPARFEKLLIPLTDTLRMQFLCDSREGLDESTDFLTSAKERGLLLDEREMPMPNSYLEIVRRLGAAYGLVLPPAPEEAAGS